MKLKQDGEPELCDGGLRRDGREEAIADLEQNLGRLSLSTLISYSSDSGDFGIDELNGRSLCDLQKEFAKRKSLDAKK